MKRGIVWGIGAVLISGALIFGLQAQEQRRAKRDAAPESPAPAAAQAPAGAVVFTFADQAQLDTFATLWNQRQQRVAKMAVLQEYWNDEQASLAELDQQLLAAYQLDTTKNYTLDTERKVLIERPAEAAAPAVESAPAVPAPVTLPSTP